MASIENTLLHHTSGKAEQWIRHSRVQCIINANKGKALDAANRFCSDLAGRLCTI